MSSENTPDLNRQGGVPLAGHATESGQVGHGSRREDLHFEPAPDHIATARFTERPEASPAPQMQTGGAEAVDRASGTGPPIEDVRVVPPAPSVWDARPPPEGEDEPGNRPGH